MFRRFVITRCPRSLFPPTAPRPAAVPSDGALLGDADQTEIFFQRQIDRRIAEGKLTPEAANYFKTIHKMVPELHDLCHTTRRSIQETGVANPDDLSSYQQRMISERLATHGAGMASTFAQETIADQQETRTIMERKDGTGKNLWVEVEQLYNTDPIVSLPQEVKDQIFDDMTADRPRMAAEANERAAKEEKAMRDMEAEFKKKSSGM